MNFFSLIFWDGGANTSFVPFYKRYLSQQKLMYLVKKINQIH